MDLGKKKKDERERERGGDRKYGSKVAGGKKGCREERREEKGQEERFGSGISLLLPYYSNSELICAIMSPYCIETLCKKRVINRKSEKHI